MQKIFVIIVTFNGAKWIEKCVLSVLKSDFVVAIVIVDNASTDETLQLIKKFNNIALIESKVNLGFGKANNIGIKYAINQGADGFFLLNQDTWISQNTIAILAKKIKLFPEFGVLSPMHFASNEIELDFNFNTYYRESTKMKNHLVAVPFVNAAAWLVSKKCFERVGFFEPLFNHYGEDRNFCNRAKFHNFKIGIAVDSKIVHDRISKRNFKKAIIQSQFLILNDLLNINNCWSKSWFLGSKRIVGLPLYFLKNYGWLQSIQLFFELLVYFCNAVIHYKKIALTRATSLMGENGKYN